MSIIYFDHNSTTTVADSVLAKMSEVYQLPINSSAIHHFGRKGEKIVEESRDSLKTSLNATNYDVTFTGSGTEATNLAFFGSHIQTLLFAGIEHSSVYNAKPQHCDIIEIKTLENGIIDLSDLEQQLDTITNPNFLVSVMLANNETGAIQPVAQIAKLVHQKGGLIHSDIIQAFGKIPVDLEELNVDFASVSAHKVNGPQGVGALLRRKGLDIQPIIFGGGQEGYKRSGTVNVAGVAGFGEACKLVNNKVKSFQDVENLRNFLEVEISNIAKEDVKIFSYDVKRLPNTSFIALKSSATQTQLINFDLHNICVSSGAACSSGTLQESRILKSMNADPDFAQGAIRISLGENNTKEEVTQFIKIWKQFYQKTKH